ncbi:MAG: MFS transporter [Desulfobacteraceae bacterium]|nr:MFS transporter [Desulfobacteraceae bacterium]
MGKKNKALWGWVFYDWANSAFATTVIAGFFPVFFKSYWSFNADVNLSTARLGLGNACASLLVALMAPLLGAIADRGSARKKLLFGFAYLGVICTLALFMVQKGQWRWAILIYAIGNIGWAGANIFYDALLPSAAIDGRIHRTSSLGYAMGYLGGGLLFAVNVGMTLHPGLFGIPDAATAVRLSFVTVALWWGGFSLLTVFWVPEEKPACPLPLGQLIRNGFRQYIETFRQIKQLKEISLFLLAYWFYIDGVHTIIRMAVDYGLSLGFESTDLILALLITQFVGFPAALIFGKLGQDWGARRSIYLGIGMYFFITLWGSMMTVKQEFYILAVLIGLAQGGIQALSRSYYARLIPVGQSAEYYGFYNMLGKFAAILGPALMGTTGYVTRQLLLPDSPDSRMIETVGKLSSRISIASILIFFIVGAILFYFVDDEKGRKQAVMLAQK